MKTIVKIDGMMCPKCASRVSNALKEAFPNAEVCTSCEQGESMIVGDGLSVDESMIQKTVSGLGYTVVSVSNEND